MKTYDFENLEVWNQSRQLVKEIYRLQSSFPAHEKYGLGDQMRRAVISVASNYVEGNTRRSDKEKVHFIDISLGSLMEVYCQLILAHDLGYVGDEQLSTCSNRINRINKLLNGLRYKKIKSYQNT
jgi:four helix bundle protein